MATVPSTLIFYLWTMLVWQWSNRLCLSETCLKWQRRSKVPPNARCVPGRTILHHIISEMSKTTFHEAVTEKLCARWVPKMLTDDHKTKRMDSALKFLTRYSQGRDEFLDSIVTGDEKWGFHYTPESKKQSLQWRHTHFPRTKKLAGLWIGAAISNTSYAKKAGSTTVKRTRLTGKGSRSTAVLPS